MQSTLNQVKKVEILYTRGRKDVIPKDTNPSMAIKAKVLETLGYFLETMEHRKVSTRQMREHVDDAKIL